MENEELKALFTKLEPYKSQEVEPSAPSAAPFWRWNQVKIYLPYALGIIFLLALFKKNPEAPPNPASRRAPLIVLVPMVPIPKGNHIPNAILKVAAVDEKSLTKAQSIQVVLEHDLDKLEQKLKAKKTLPPGRPIFWRDLELDTPNATMNKPKIIFSKEAL